MKKLEVKGLGGLHIEIYDPKGMFTELEMMKEASKTLGREVLRYEHNTKHNINSHSNSDKLPE
jgi:phage-related minor tail protein